MCPTCDEPPRADLVCKAHFAERHAWLSKLDMPSLGMYDDE